MDTGNDMRVKGLFAKACLLALAFVTAAVLIGGCSQSNGGATSASGTSDASSESSSVVTSDIDESLYDLAYTNRDKDPSYDESDATVIELSGTSAAVAGEGAAADGGTVTVADAGVYILSGTLADGRVVVNAPEDAKVQLVLDGASIANSTGTAIYVQEADKCFITLADGSSNSVSDGASYAFEGDATEPDAAIFCTCDLTLQGSGSLQVSGNYNDAVKTKDDLVITGGTYDITAQGDGLVGKDCVKVADGRIAISTSEGDGIKSSKDTDETKGFVSIDGGDITVDAADKGIKAVTYLRIAGGTLDIAAADDTLHCDGSGRVLGGDMTLDAGDDALHVEYMLVIDDGTVDVTGCYEGYEGQTITVNGGSTHIVASDDGMNASSPNSGNDAAGAVMSGDGGPHQMGRLDYSGDAAAPAGEAPEPPEGASEGDAPAMAEGGQGEQGVRGGRGMGGMRGQDGSGPTDAAGGFGGNMGGGMMDADEACVITFNGGRVEVESGGDGIDSNGSIVMNGGYVYVSGPTSSADGALDCGTVITCNGGTMIAVGAAGMAEGFTDGAQAFGQVSLNGQAGIEIQVKDASGTAVASYTPTKSYQNIVVTSEGMADGQAYTVSAGSSASEFTASTEGSAAGGFGGGAGGQMPTPQGRGMGGRTPSGGPSGSAAA